MEIPEGWQVFDQHGSNLVTRSGSPSIEIDLSDDLFEINCEQGSGYCREHITFHVPVSVIMNMLAVGGYTLTREST